MGKVKKMSIVGLQKIQKPIKALMYELESSKGKTEVRVAGGREGDLRGCQQRRRWRN